MRLLTRIKSWLSYGLDDGPIGGLTGVQFNDPEVFRLRMQRAAQTKAFDELWASRHRAKAEVVPFHGRAKP